MKRRTLLGSAAMTLGGASVIGTGAFTSVEAERSISVDVVGDEQAFLKLEACTVGERQSDDPFRSSDFVKNGDGTIAIDVSQSVSDNIDVEKGITEDSLWRFPNAFRIANQGSQPVCVDLRVENGDEKTPETKNSGEVEIDGTEQTFGSEVPAVVFYPASNTDNKFSQDLDPTGGIKLDPSDRQCIGFDVRTFGLSAGEGTLKNLTLIIRADARSNCDNGMQNEYRGKPIDLNPVAQFDATRLDLSPEDDVGEWSSKVSEGDEITVSAGQAASAATYKQDVFNSGGVYFDGSDGQILSAESVSGLNIPEFTIFTVFSPDQVDDQIGVLHAKQGSNEDPYKNRNWWHSIDSGQGYIGGNDNLGFRSSSDGDIAFTLSDEEEQYTSGRYVSSVRVSGTEAELWINGDKKQQSEFDGSIDTGNQDFYIGGTKLDDDPRRRFKGTISEIIIYDKPLTLQERADIEASLYGKHGL